MAYNSVSTWSSSLRPGPLGFLSWAPCWPSCGYISVEGPRHSQGQSDVPSWGPHPSPLDHALGFWDPRFPSQMAPSPLPGNLLQNRLSQERSTLVGAPPSALGVAKRQMLSGGVWMERRYEGCVSTHTCTGPHVWQAVGESLSQGAGLDLVMAFFLSPTHLHFLGFLHSHYSP